MRAVEIVNEDVRKRVQAAVRFNPHVHHIQGYIDETHEEPDEDLTSQQEQEINAESIPGHNLDFTKNLYRAEQADDEFPIRRPARRRQGMEHLQPGMLPSKDDEKDALSLKDSDFASIQALQSLGRPSMSSGSATESRSFTLSSAEIKTAKPTIRPTLGVARLVSAVGRPARKQGATASEPRVSSTTMNKLVDPIRSLHRGLQTKGYGRADTLNNECFLASPSSTGPPLQSAMPSVTDALAPTFADGYSLYHPKHSYDTHRDSNLQTSFAALPRNARSTFAGVVESVMEQRILPAERALPFGARAKVVSWARMAKAKAQSTLGGTSSRTNLGYPERATNADPDLSDNVSIMSSKSALHWQCRGFSQHPQSAAGMQRDPEPQSPAPEIIWIDGTGQRVLNPPVGDFDTYYTAAHDRYHEMWLSGARDDDAARNNAWHDAHPLEGPDEYHGRMNARLSKTHSGRHHQYQGRAHRQQKVAAASRSSGRLAKEGFITRRPSAKHHHVGRGHHHFQRVPSNHRQQRAADSARSLSMANTGGGMHGGRGAPQSLGSCAPSEAAVSQRRRGGILDASAETRLNIALEMARLRIEREIKAGPAPPKQMPQRRSGRRRSGRRRRRTSSLHYVGVQEQTSAGHLEGPDDASIVNCAAADWADEEDDEDGLASNGASDDDDEGDADNAKEASTGAEPLYDSEQERRWLDEAYDEAVRKEGAYSNFCAHHPAHLGGAW